VVVELAHKVPDLGSILWVSFGCNLPTHIFFVTLYLRRFFCCPNFSGSYISLEGMQSPARFGIIYRFT
jgi:hypothetical protein